MTTHVRQLGRRKPLENYVRGDWRVVVTPDGRTRYFPRMAVHYNRANDVAPPPPSVDYGAKAGDAIAQVYLNDQLGDCVIASRYHAIGVWTGNATGTPAVGTDAEVSQTYRRACGPGDRGCDMAAVNQYQQATGVPVSGVVHKIAGAAAVDNTNQNLVMVCLDLFGSLNVGMNLPQAWYQSADGSDWGPVTGADAEIVGGHEVQAFGYDSQGVLIATWGGTRRILWPAFLAPTWIDELYTALAPDWTADANLAPNGIDAATLASDLEAVAGGQVPPLPGPTPPTPVPTPTPPAPTPTPPVPVSAFSGTLTFQNGALATATPAASKAVPDRGLSPAQWAALIAVIAGAVAEILGDGTLPTGKPCGCK
jgi:hypothetical protein